MDFSSPSFSILPLRLDPLELFKSYWWLPLRIDHHRVSLDIGSPGDSWLFWWFVELGMIEVVELFRHLSRDKCCLALLNVNRSWLARVDIRLVLRSLKLSSSSLYDEMSSASWSSDGHQLSSELTLLRAEGVCSSFLCNCRSLEIICCCWWWGSSISAACSSPSPWPRTHCARHYGWPRCAV